MDVTVGANKRTSMIGGMDFKPPVSSCTFKEANRSFKFFLRAIWNVRFFFLGLDTMIECKACSGTSTATSSTISLRRWQSDKY
jgi:hypothetical protein